MQNLISAITVFPCYTYVCSVMRSYCPANLVTLGSTYGPPHPKIWYIFFFLHILDFNLKSSFQIASLFDMYISIWVRGYLESKIGPVWSLNAPQAPPSSKKCIFYSHFALYMKNWLLIVFSCCAYVSTVMKCAFSDILVPQDPEKKFFFSFS